MSVAKVMGFGMFFDSSEIMGSNFLAIFIEPLSHDVEQHLCLSGGQT
jgi:hypothetical protein